LKKKHRNEFLKKYKCPISLIVVIQSVLFIWLCFRGPEQALNYLLIFLFFSGCTIIMLLIVRKSYPEQVAGGLSAIEDTMKLAEITMPYLREGLDSESAMTIVKIIRNISNIPAVGITDKKNVLAFIGEGCEHHPAGYPIRTQATLDAIIDGQLHIIKNKNEFNCKVKDCVCPLDSAIIVPLFNKIEVIGCLKFYYLDKSEMSEEQIRLAVGMGKLLTMQLELADFERQRQLTTEAKLDALQAQVNPHFLFNALNTVNMYINKDPVFARKLMVKLSTLLRYLMNEKRRLIPLYKEIQYVKNYVTIENARFQNKIEVRFNIDPRFDKIEIPVLSIQPLVHNSIIHGILPQNRRGVIDVSVIKLNESVQISVADNGIGISGSDLQNIFNPGFGTGCGIGISNVDERMRLLYGDRYGIQVRSQLGAGTTVILKIPITEKAEA